MAPQFLEFLDGMFIQFLDGVAQQARDGRIIQSGGAHILEGAGKDPDTHRYAIHPKIFCEDNKGPEDWRPAHGQQSQRIVNHDKKITYQAPYSCLARV